MSRARIGEAYSVVGAREADLRGNATHGLLLDRHADPQVRKASGRAIPEALVGALLIGSIPGGIIGTRLASYVPSYWLRRILCGVLFVTGARMLLV